MSTLSRFCALTDGDFISLVVALCLFIVSRFLSLHFQFMKNFIIPKTTTTTHRESVRIEFGSSEVNNGKEKEKEKKQQH